MKMEKMTLEWDINDIIPSGWRGPHVPGNNVSQDNVPQCNGNDTLARGIRDAPSSNTKQGSPSLDNLGG